MKEFLIVLWISSSLAILLVLFLIIFYESYEKIIEIHYAGKCFDKLNTLNRSLLKEMLDQGIKIKICSKKLSSFLDIEDPYHPVICIRPRNSQRRIKDLNAAFIHTLLHEYGHFIDFSNKTVEDFEASIKRRKGEIVDKNVYKEEVKAWLIAKRLAKNCGVKLQRKYIKGCLNTYKSAYKEDLYNRSKR